MANEVSEKNSAEVLKRILEQAPTIWVKRCENCEKRDSDNFWNGFWLFVGGLFVGALWGGAASRSATMESERQFWRDNVIVLDPIYTTSDGKPVTPIT